MPADGLTKNLTRQQFERFVRMLNLKNVRERVEQEDKSRETIEKAHNGGI